MTRDDIWDTLREHAAAAAEKSYSPYSRYPVGAAALTESGRIVTGTNVENASYGLTLCAECVMIGDAVMNQAGGLVAFVCVNGDGELITPCGRCRQLLFEHRIRPDDAADTTTLQVLTNAGVLPIDHLLPQAFDVPDELRA